MADTKEYDTLSKSISSLVTALKADIKEISVYLFNEGFITNELFEEVLEAKTMLSDKNKAEKLMVQIRDCVKLDPSKYYKLVNHWRQNQRLRDTIVQVLDSEYFGFRTVPSHHGEELQADDVYKRLSVVRDRWYDIGCGLRVPSECLDKFHSLSDPLLEVITHWLKSATETWPSWNEVVSALREQGISEVELVGLITIHSQHKEVERTEADSDVTSQLVKVQPKQFPQREIEGHKLERKTNDIKKDFARFVRELLRHMNGLAKNGEIGVSEIKTEVLIYSKKLKPAITKCKSLPDIFNVLSEKASFLDYDILKLLIDYGNGRIKKMFIEYKKKLQGFLEARLIEQPSGEGERVSYVVLIDQIIEEDNADSEQLLNRVKIILGLQNVTLLRWENLHHQAMPSHKEKLLSSEAAVMSLQGSTSTNSSETTSQHSISEATLQLDSCNTSASSELAAYQEQLPEREFSILGLIANDRDFSFLQMIDEATKLSSKSQLHIKASEGDLTSVIEMIENGHNPMEQDENGNAPPHYGARNGHLNVVKYYVSVLGCNPAVEGNQNNTQLNFAVLGGHLEIVQYLLDNEVEALCQANRGITPLHQACFLGHNLIVMELVRNISSYLQPNQDCNAQCANADKVTPLHLAAAGGHLPIIKYLILDKKCDPMCKDIDGNTPLHTAAANGQVEIVEYLLSKCFNDPLIKDKKGNTIVHYAASKGHLNVVKFLIESGLCKSTLPGSNNVSLLHIAASSGNLDLVKYLIDTQDYAAFCENAYKLSPIHAAAINGHMSIIKFFASKKFCDLMCNDFYGFTPLHYAAATGNKPITEFISSNSNDKSKAVGKNGRNALHMAAIRGHLDIVKYFIEEQCFNPSLLDTYKQCPLSLAAANGHLPVVVYLIKHCEVTLKRTEYAFAAGSGHLEIVKFLNSTTNYTPDKEGHNALYRAAQAGHLPVVQFLVSNYYDPLHKDAAGITPLHAAAGNCHLKVVQYYISELSQTCSPQESLDNESNNILHFAVLGGSIDLVRYLVDEENISFFQSNARGQTPLHIASVCGHLSLVKYLIHS